MSAPAAIQGTFADMRTVKSRAVVQLLIEVPIEQADAALRALGGVPQPHDPKWVAIARLDPKAASKAEEPKERKAWADLPPATQAGMRCGEYSFMQFMHERHGAGARPNQTDTEYNVRALCGVSSRSELNDNHKARVIWHQLDREFCEWNGRLAHG